MNNKKKILVVDDEREILNMYLSILSDDYSVVIAHDYVEAVFKYTNQEFDLVITDLRMPNRDGVDLVKEIRRLEEVLKRENSEILISSGCIEEFQKKLLDCAEIELLEKPFAPEYLLNIVERLLKGAKSVESFSGIKRVSVAKKKVILKSGNIIKGFLKVLDGELGLFNREAKQVGSLVKNEVFGDLKSGVKKSDVSLIALVQSELLYVPDKAFLEILKSQPAWFQEMVINLSKKLENTEKLVS